MSIPAGSATHSGTATTLEEICLASLACTSAGCWLLLLIWRFGPAVATCNWAGKRVNWLSTSRRFGVIIGHGHCIGCWDSVDLSMTPRLWDMPSYGKGESMGFEGRTVLVTGAVGSIGKGIATGFCNAGAHVFITDLDQGAVDTVIEEIVAQGGKCQGLAADVTDEEQVSRVVDAARDTLGGKIDILVNVAGAVSQGKVEDITADDWDKMFAVNCKGTFLFIKHVVPLMKANRFGKIVSFSSKSGKTGSALMTAYSAAKAAIIGLTQALAYELADYGITVNCLCPGIVEATGVWAKVSAGYIKNLNLSEEEVIKRFTAKVPLNRLARIDDVVAVTMFLASEGADYMTGQAINVTGGREMH